MIYKYTYQHGISGHGGFVKMLIKRYKTQIIYIANGSLAYINVVERKIVILGA